MTMKHALTRAKLAVKLAECAGNFRNLRNDPAKVFRLGALSAAAHDLAGGDREGAREALRDAAYWRRLSRRVPA